MPHISRKKQIYPISEALRNYLHKVGREMILPIRYKDLLRYEAQYTIFDKNGNDSLWVKLHYSPSDTEELHTALKEMYSIMMSHKNTKLIEHLYVDSIDLCLYGNTKPFRIRIKNRLNDNQDYFYVKNADASRICGLELEHWISPNRMNFKVYQETLVEEHIVGIPGAAFASQYIEKSRIENEIRLAKEFVKFNERCFVRLLGDMHSSNFVVDITPDFEDVHYRIRAIDFDQQCYEGRKSIYMPKYYKQNHAFIEVGQRNITFQTMQQYEQEERSMIAERIRYSHENLDALLDAMKASVLSLPEYIMQLRKELAIFYQTDEFYQCRNMGEILELSLSLLMARN